jgi:nucleoside-diphosphate-sugar epimerase
VRVVVTGGSGRLGQFVVSELFARGHQVSVLDTTKPRECLFPTYAADLSKASLLQDYFKGVDAVVHLARQRFPYTETGFNVTAQRWEFSDRAGDAERFNWNIAMTNNVLTASEIAGVRKIVCGSSLAIYGLYYPITPRAPDYLPVDEEHPLRPQDPYGLSKLVGEKLCEALSQRSGIQIASLRFSGIYTEQHRALLAERSKNPLIRGTGALWSYIDARDAARACRLALETDFAGHQAFNVCASVTIMETPTRELVSRYLPQVQLVRDGEGNWCGYDTKKAETVLVFRALHLIGPDVQGQSHDAIGNSLAGAR